MRGGHKCGPVTATAAATLATATGSANKRPRLSPCHHEETEMYEIGLILRRKHILIQAHPIKQVHLLARACVRACVRVCMRAWMGVFS